MAPSSQLKTEKLQPILEQLIEENLGMPMVFTLTQSAKDWLDEACENVNNDKQLTEGNNPTASSSSKNTDLANLRQTFVILFFVHS